MANILTATEASQTLRCAVTDPQMLALLPAVDEYIHQATGHNWAADATVHQTAKNAARILITLWHENPGMIAQGASALPWGLSATIAQLQALALRYRIFEGVPGAGYLELPGARAGDTVTELIGVVGATGDQSAKFDAIIIYDNLLRQVSGENLDGMYFRVLLTPPE